MTFGDALEQMKAGRKVRRRGWQHPRTIYAEYTRDMVPYLMQKRQGIFDSMPYTPTDTDLFAQDWEVMDTWRHQDGRNWD